MTQENKAKYEAMENVTLVEELLSMQSRVEHLHQRKCEASKESTTEQYLYYAEQYYQAMFDLVELKYMVVGRMRVKL